MSGNGSPAHRASSPVQRNRLIAAGAGLLLLLILLFALLAYCTNPDDPASTTGSPGPSTGAPASASPGAGSPTGGDAAALPSGSAPVTPTGEVATEDPTDGPTGDPAGDPADDDPERSSTPEGGVDAGGGSQIDGRRLVLLVTGGFLLVSAAAVGAYSLRRPLHHGRP